jgi:CRP-like cAMP-binding protein
MLLVETAKQVVIEKGWLSMTPPSFQRAVLDRCRLQGFKAGESVYRLGDPPGGMFGLVSGGLGVSVGQGECSPYIGHFALPGAWFGEAAAMTRQPRRIGLTATRDTQMFHLPLPKIDEIVADDPTAWRWLALVTVGHLDTAISACDDLMLRDHVKRCIALLLRLSGCRRMTPSGPTPVEIDIRQDEIATLANVARTTAGKVLGMLEAKGLVEQSYRRVRILAPDALRAMLRD